MESLKYKDLEKNKYYSARSNDNNIYLIFLITDLLYNDSEVIGDVIGKSHIYQFNTHIRLYHRSDHILKITEATYEEINQLNCSKKHNKYISNDQALKEAQFYIDKGDYLYCHTSLIMDRSKQVEAIAGKYYKSEWDGCFTDESKDKHHRIVDYPGFWFTKVTQKEYNKNTLFIKGEWYEYYDHIGKFFEIQNNIFVVSEYIYKKEYYKGMYKWGGEETFHQKKLITDLSLILPYLPHDHPDKVKTNLPKLEEDSNTKLFKSSFIPINVKSIDVPTIKKQPLELKIFTAKLIK